MPTPDLVVRGALWNGAVSDLLVKSGKVLELAAYDETRDYSGRQVDAHDLLLLPSLIDAHAHFREPGFEYKEDVASGLAAAAHGGFGQVMCMANTEPVNDNSSITEHMLAQAKRHWPKGPRLLPIGALTKGLAGKELTPMAELAAAGCAAFSNDGLPVSSAELFRRGMEYASDLGKIVIDHCQDPDLGVDGSMNESALSGTMGLKGQPTAAEAIQAARDCILASYLDLPVHIAHVSCRESVEVIAWAKAKGAKVSAETCPHYLLFTEERVRGYNPRAKVNPPLRSDEDVAVLRAALAEGTIDMLATDHAPHADHEKERPFEDAPFGISGLDTALSLTWSLVSQNLLTLEQLMEAWCYGPGRVFSLPVNRFQAGDPADFVLFDPHAVWEVSPQAMHSKGKNTPCLGDTLPGRVQAHFMGGKRIV